MRSGVVPDSTLNDIDCPDAMARVLHATGPGVLDEVKKLSIKFAAGKSAARPVNVRLTKVERAP